MSICVMHHREMKSHFPIKSYIKFTAALVIIAPKSEVGTGNMAYWIRMLVAQAWGPEFESPAPI